MWTPSSRGYPSGYVESSRGLRVRCDDSTQRLSIRGSSFNTEIPWRVELSDDEIAKDLMATLPKLHAAVASLANRRPCWRRKTSRSDIVEVFELQPTLDSAGDDMDIAHAVLAVTELQCSLGEVLNVLVNHTSSQDFEASMRAIVPKRKIRQGEVLLQPHNTKVSGVDRPRVRVEKPRGARQRSRRTPSTYSSAVEDSSLPSDATVSINMTRFRSKRRLDLSGRLSNRRKRSQQLCLATLTQQLIPGQHAVHVIKTLPRKLHDQMAPLAEKHRQQSVLGNSLDHIAVGFDIQTRRVPQGGNRGDIKVTRIVAHGYASVTAPELFGEHASKKYPQYSPMDLAHYRATLATVETTHVLELLTTSLRNFERVIRRRRLGLQTFMRSKPEHQTDNVQRVGSCGVCYKRFSLLRRDSLCQLCGHTVCRDCSNIYEVEPRIGQLRKNRVCWRCIGNVDSCVFDGDDEASTTSEDATAPSKRKSVSPCVSDSDSTGHTGSTLMLSDLDSPEALTSSMQSGASAICSQTLEDLDKLISSNITKSARGNTLSTEQIASAVESHLQRSFRAVEHAYPALSRVVTGIPILEERDYPLDYEEGRTLSPRHPLPPRPSPSQESSRLQYIAKSGALGLKYDRRALNMLAQITAKQLDCPVGYVSMIDETTQHVVGLHPDQAIGAMLPREEAMCSHTIYEDKPLVVSNALQDVRYRHMGFITQTGVKFYAGFPVRAPDGAVVATLCASDFKPRQAISSEQYAAMETLTWLAGRILLPEGTEQ